MTNYIQQNMDVTTYRSASFVWIIFIAVERTVLVDIVYINGTDICKVSKWQDTAPLAKHIYYCV